LTDALKSLATESTTNPKVKKKLMAVLLSWQNQFKSDPSMTLVAGLYKQCRHQVSHPKDKEIADLWVPQPSGEEERLKKEEKERKRMEKEKREEEKRRQKSKNKPKTRRERFDFDKVRSRFNCDIKYTHSITTLCRRNHRC
jgi:LAS seventeen-binding protein 5